MPCGSPPEIIAATRFALSRSPCIHVLGEVHDGKPSNAPWNPAQTAGRIVIGYGKGKAEAGSYLLYEDGWIAVGPASRKGAEREPIGFDSLRAAPCCYQLWQEPRWGAASAAASGR